MAKALYLMGFYYVELYPHFPTFVINLLLIDIFYNSLIGFILSISDLNIFISVCP